MKVVSSLVPFVHRNPQIIPMTCIIVQSQQARKPSIMVCKQQYSDWKKQQNAEVLDDHMGSWFKKKKEKKAGFNTF